MRVPGGAYQQMKATIRLIGDAIRAGSHYGPIRFRAAALAAKAPPKDYLGQAKAVFDNFVRRWRYVRDPVDRELVAVSPQQIYTEIMGGDRGIGTGDCDDATVAIGAQLASIGFPVRIATIAPQGAPPGRLMTHVFPQALVPGVGWVTVDPVVYPDHGFGYLPPHSRLVTWDLAGNLITKMGNARNMHGLLGRFETMTEWKDFAGFGDYTTAPTEMLPDFREVGIRGFGAFAEQMGMCGGYGLSAEVDIDEQGRAWTPALELAPQDYVYIQQHGMPYHGMLGLGDNGYPYEYDSNLGFFKKLFRRVKKRVSRIARKVLKKLPGGKYLLRLGKKVWKLSKKLVRPLAKFVGKYATKLAPVAALIPGYGPAIAAALYTAGKVARLMNKYGVKLTGKKGNPRKLRFPSGKAAKAFQNALKRAAKARKQSVRRKVRVRTRRLRQAPSQRSRRVSKRYSRMAQRGASRFRRFRRAM